MRRTLAPLGLYGLLSVLLYGTGVLHHFDTRILAADDIDSGGFMWFYAWWPHALTHGLNPFVTHLMFAPDGYNLTWSTSMPLPSLLFAPLTLTAGPVVTWNVLQLLGPALAGWTTFLLCRHVTGRTDAALFGGFLFGFSPYMAAHLTGGPYLTLVFVLPLIVLLVLRRLEGSMRPRRFVLLLAAALLVQAGISTEVLATATVFGAFALIAAFALLAERRAELVALVKETAVAYALTAVVLSPFLYYFFFGPDYAPSVVPFPADLLSPVVPPGVVALATKHHGLASVDGASAEAYFGLPLVAIAVLYVWRRRRDRPTWVLAAAALAAFVASLGGTLFVGHHNTGIPMPWRVFEHLPVLRYAIPLRLAVFALLPIVVLAALWLSRTAGRWRWVAAALAVAAIVPPVGSSLWNSDATDPAFFSTGQYKRYLHPADRVLTIPAIGRNERWQADTEYGFTLAAGYAGTTFPAGYTRFPIWRTVAFGAPTPPNAEAELRRFLAAKQVDAIVVDPSTPGPSWPALFGTLGVAPEHLGGILLYRLHDGRAQ